MIAGSGKRSGKEAILNPLVTRGQKEDG